MTQAAAFRPLEKEYRANSYTFRLVKREGMVVMYRQFDVDESGEEIALGYEVFEVIQRPEEWVGPKRYHQPPREAVPLPSEWGAKAFSPSSREQAESRFQQLLNNIAHRQVVSGTPSPENKKSETIKRRP